MQLLKIEEVAVLLGVSCKTINNWYQFKNQNPDSEYAKMLPEFKQEHARQTRYWNTDDLWKLIEFKSKLPKGRNGIMGSLRRKTNEDKK